MLSINNISKTYHSIDGEIESIKDISFDIKEKEFISIIGTSGSGKSTLLNVIANLDKDYKGTINKKNNLIIGYMFQSDALFDWLTILGNSMLGLVISKKATTESRNHVINLLKKYGLYEFKDKYPSSLSGGMKQRVGWILYTH